MYLQFLRNVHCNFIYLRRYLHSSVGSTIYALSSGYGKCGVAVIRVSGPCAGQVIQTVTGLTSLPRPRTALLRSIMNPLTKETLDRGIIIWFPGPKSFTGEDCCELQIHGGPAVISATFSALANIPGLRPAEPGEFTKRAFYAGKLGLTEVEGLGDLIQAETETQRKQALIQMEGSLQDMYTGWRQKLIKAVAHVEAYIDFSEDQNIEENVIDNVNVKIKELQDLIQRHLVEGRRGERLRDGVKTAIIGAPNVGKSSLLNSICLRPAAIVSPMAGTTRDVVTSTLDVGGFPVILSDTAGLHQSTSDIVEQEGIVRAMAAASSADLILLVVDASHFTKPSKNSPLERRLLGYIDDLHLIEEVHKAILCQIKSSHDQAAIAAKTKCLVVFNKTDLIGNEEQLAELCSLCKESVAVSCTTGFGINSLVNKLTAILKDLCGEPCAEHPSYSQARHRHHLVECLHSLDNYFLLSAREADLAAEQLRYALGSLGQITGHVSTEQILDVIFQQFCVGK